MASGRSAVEFMLSFSLAATDIFVRTLHFDIQTAGGCSDDTVAMIRKGWDGLVRTVKNFPHLPTQLCQRLAVEIVWERDRAAERVRAEFLPVPIISERDPPQSSVKFNKKKEARDEWIYRKCCKGTPHEGIVEKLKALAPKRGWKTVGSKQRIQQIGNEYAERHGLPPPAPRRNL